MDEKLKLDFPIDWEEDHYVSRREFFKFVTLASGGLAAGSTALAVWSQLPRDSRRFEKVRIAHVKDVPIDGSLEFSYPRPTDLCLLIRQKSGQLVAYSRRCTHLSCPVEFEPDRERLYCPCHNGAFSLEDGHVLQGPPPRPLPRIELAVEGDQVYAIGVRLA